MTENCQNWFYLCLSILGAFTLLFLMHLGYSLTLGKHTAKLEKKNGHELERIEKLESKNGKELKEIKKLKGEIRLLKALMTLSEEARQKQAQENQETDDEWDNENE